MRGQKPISIVFALLTACGTPDLPGEALEAVVPSGAVFDAMQPEPWLEAVLDADGFLGALPESSDCPAVTVEEMGWTAMGSCETAAGDRVEGALSWLEYDGGVRVVGDNFRVWEGESLTLVFDGALEASRIGELLEVEAAVTACGGPAAACDEGLTALDVSYGAYPVSGVPEAYDVTVTGVVAAPGFEATSVDGAWTVDDTACASEPASGTLLIAGDVHQALDFDGDLACEGCATRTVAGFAADPLCDLR